MEESVGSCEKCGGPMTKGIAAYRVNANYYPLFWIEGEPPRRSLLGIKGDNLNISGHETKKIKAFRCDSCGFLQAFAV